jgi:hypothetical protein
MRDNEKFQLALSCNSFLSLIMLACCEIASSLSDVVFKLSSLMIVGMKEGEGRRKDGD